MRLMSISYRKAVLGLGNLLYQDEGFGIHALRALEMSFLGEAEVEFVDGGVLGMNLLPLVEECSHLLVLDAVDAGKKPGTILELRGEHIPQFASASLSEHQVGFQEVLGLARFRGNLPPNLHLIGVQPENMSSGISLSQAVSTALPEIVDLAMAKLKAWQLA
jgi:hydrogenase maturation protease